MIIAIEFAIILIIIASAITTKWKFKQENSILLTFLSTGIFTYVLGLINLMKFSIYIILALTVISIIYLIYAFIKKKVKVKEIITPGTIIYFITIFVVTWFVKGTFYTEWDEFSHWGSNLKAMVSYDLLWSNQIYDGVHVVYPPFAGIIEYIVCKLNGGFAEDVSYVGITFFVITLLMPFLTNLKYNWKDFLKGFLIIFAVYVFALNVGYTVTSIYIDFLLSMLFLAGMYISFRDDGKEDKILLLLVCIALPLLKDTGLLMLGIILMQLFFRKVVLKIYNDKKLTKESMKIFGKIIILLLIPLCIYATWKVYCSANNRFLDDRHDKNAISNFDVKEYLKAITVLKATPGKLQDIATSFYSALNDLGIISKYPFSTVLQLLVCLDLIGVALYHFQKDDKKRKNILILFITMNIGFLLYCLLLMATFMFAFTELEGRSLASYDRYMKTYFLAWIGLVIGITSCQAGKKGLISAIIAVLIALYGCSPIQIIKPKERGVSGISQEVKEKGDIINNNLEKGDKVYLIYQNIGGGLEYHQLRYCISPIVTNLMYEWSLGPKYSEGDIWSYDISKEDFEKKLIDEEFDYIFIAKSDEQFINIYGSLFDSSIDLNDIENKIFKVVVQDGHVTFQC